MSGVDVYLASLGVAEEALECCRIFSVATPSCSMSSPRSTISTFSSCADEAASPAAPLFLEPVLRAREIANEAPATSAAQGAAGDVAGVEKERALRCRLTNQSMELRAISAVGAAAMDEEQAAVDAEAKEFDAAPARRVAALCSDKARIGHGARLVAAVRLQRSARARQVLRRRRAAAATQAAVVALSSTVVKRYHIFTPRDELASTAPPTPAFSAQLSPSTSEEEWPTDGSAPLFPSAAAAAVDWRRERALRGGGGSGGTGGDEEHEGSVRRRFSDESAAASGGVLGRGEQGAAAAHAAASVDASLASYVVAAAKEPKLQATAAGAVAGGAMGGVVGGTLGTAAGGVVGAAVGVIPALFTFGLSIPLFVAVGSGVGLCAGTAAGGSVGAIGGGAASYAGYKHRQSLWASAALAWGGVARLHGSAADGTAAKIGLAS